MGKGSEFEREICKQLGLWWSGGLRDDIFWRSSNSGGRATVRSRKSQTTHGHYGDIAATDPVGAPLLQIATLELKRGYSEANFHALLDRARFAAQQPWEAWIQQAVEAHKLAGSFSWAIIAKRDGRERIIVMDWKLWRALKNQLLTNPDPLITLSVNVRYKIETEKNKWKLETHPHRIAAMRWERWLEIISPKMIRSLCND